MEIINISLPRHERDLLIGCHGGAMLAPLVAVPSTSRRETSTAYGRRRSIRRATRRPERRSGSQRPRDRGTGGKRDVRRRWRRGKGGDRKRIERDGGVLIATGATKYRTGKKRGPLPTCRPGRSGGGGGEGARSRHYLLPACPLPHAFGWVVVVVVVLLRMALLLPPFLLALVLTGRPLPALPPLPYRRTHHRFCALWRQVMAHIYHRRIVYRECHGFRKEGRLRKEAMRGIGRTRGRGVRLLPVWHRRRIMRVPHKCAPIQSRCKKTERSETRRLPSGVLRRVPYGWVYRSGGGGGLDTVAGRSFRGRVICRRERGGRGWWCAKGIHRICHKDRTCMGNESKGVAIVGEDVDIPITHADHTT